MPAGLRVARHRKCEVLYASRLNLTRRSSSGSTRKLVGSRYETSFPLSCRTFEKRARQLHAQREASKPEAQSAVTRFQDLFTLRNVANDYEGWSRGKS